MSKQILTSESRNPLTEQIDDVSPEEGVSLICRAYDYIFTACDGAAICKIAKLADAIGEVMDKGGYICGSGAGTSGRLLLHVLNYISQYYPNCEGFIAGHEHGSILEAYEKAEDDAESSIRDLEIRINGKNRPIIDIGLTCSGAAPAVWAPIHEIATNQRLDDVYSALIMFNPVESLDKDEIIEGTGKTRPQIAESLDYLIDIALGAEPLTGSTRMIGGSLSKMILEMITLIPLMKRGVIESDYDTTISTEFLVRKFLENYKNALEIVKQSTKDIAGLAEMAKESLLSDEGHVYYLSEDGFGKLCITDASECKPTFSDEFDDVRGYVRGGWDAFITKDQIDRIDPEFIEKRPLSLEDFKKLKLNENDTVVLVANRRPSKELELALEYAKKYTKKTAEIVFNREQNDADRGIAISIYPSFTAKDLPDLDCFREAALKLYLNAFTTELHIVAGKSWGNRMVDLRLSNNKLAKRGLDGILPGILEELKAKYASLQTYDFSRENRILHLNRNTILYWQENYGSLSKTVGRETREEIDQYITEFKSSSNVPNKEFNDKTIYARVKRLLPITIGTLCGLDYKDVKRELGRDKEARLVINELLAA